MALTRLLTMRGKSLATLTFVVRTENLAAVRYHNMRLSFYVLDLK
jgi:hypothetical protein